MHAHTLTYKTHHTYIQKKLDKMTVLTKTITTKFNTRETVALYAKIA